MRNKAQLAVVGAGLAGMRHIGVISSHNAAELSAVVDPDINKAKIAREYHCQCFSSIHEMFKSHHPDGIIIATPTSLHREHALECIKNLCPILIEKPIATTVNEAKDIIEFARINDISVAVGHHRRHISIIQKAKEIIQQNKLGKLRAVHAQCWLYKPDDYFDNAIWRQKKGAGPISVNLIHDVDNLRYLCGEVISVFADAVHAKRGYENEDIATINLRFENDILATMSVSDTIVAPWSWELTAHENPIYPETNESCYMIGGENASLSLPDLTLWQCEGKKSWWGKIENTKIDIEKNDPFIEQINQFIRVIKKEELPLVDDKEGLKALEVIEAAYQSLEFKKVIMLTDQ